MSKVEIFNEEDRLTVAKILVRNGYTVCQSREQVQGKRSYIYLLKYSKQKITSEEASQQ